MENNTDLQTTSVTSPTCPPATGSEPQPLPLQAAAVPRRQPERPLTADEITDGGTLGSVVVLSAAEQAAYEECEKVIRKGWDAFVDVGMALARIRDQELYRAEYASFEVYCRAKWCFEHSKVYYLISAAQVCNRLAAIPDLPRPDQESVVRPLIGLPPGMAEVAWQGAFSISGNGKITARTVRAALKELGFGPKRAERPAQRKSRLEKRRAVSDGFNELLTMIGERAATGLIIERIQSLARQVENLFAKPTE